MNLTDTIDITVRVYKGKKTVSAKETVPAKVYGPLALHKDICTGKRQLWRVTHIATGLRVLGELPLNAAIAIVKELKGLPEWQDPRLADGYCAGTTALFDKLVAAVKEAQRFHCEGGTRVVEAA